MNHHNPFRFVPILLAALVLSACTPVPAMTTPPASILPLNSPTAVPPTATAFLTPTSPPQPSPTCPKPVEGTRLLIRETFGYCLLYLEGYNEINTDPAEVCLVPEGPAMMCHTAQMFINVEDAAGRNANQAANERMAREGGIGPERESLMIAGVEAVVLPNVGGQASTREVLFVHDDRLYTLKFLLPDAGDPDGVKRFDLLYETVINSFAFLPNPSTLKIEFERTDNSPNGRWEVLVTQSETVPLGWDDGRYFYVELIVTSVEDGTTWVPVGEWHTAGLGQEDPPRPFHWSLDGRYLYFTSLFDFHGACVSANIGETLDRLDLTDGTVSALQTPHAFRLLAVSPDESMLAYLSGSSMNDFNGNQNLIVRELATAYTDGAAGQDSVLWQIPLDISWPTAVSEIAWSPDNRQLLVTATTLADDFCNLAGISTWDLDVETGVFTAKSTFTPPPVPTPTPPAPCPVPAVSREIARESFLIFCGGEDHVNIAQNDSLIIDGALTVEAYVSYLGGGGEGPRVMEIIDTFNLSISDNKVWFCLFSVGFETNQGNGWHCLTAPQPDLNQWAHLAGSWDGATMYLFINGKLMAETAFPGPLFHGGPGDQSLMIGNGWTLIDGFNGFIDEVRLSSNARYRADFVPQEEFIPDEYTVGLWHFDEGRGAVAMDESGHGNHGNLSPFLRWGPAR